MGKCPRPKQPLNQKKPFEHLGRGQEEARAGRGYLFLFLDSFCPGSRDVDVVARPYGGRALLGWRCPHVLRCCEW